MQISRRQFLARSARVGVLLGGGVPLLAACGSDAASSTSAKAMADGLKPEAGPLRIYNYADYVSPDVVAAFEQQYGVKVEITTFDNDNEAITKLANGSVSIDLMHSAAPNTVGRLINGKLVAPLNRTYLTNFANIRSAFNNPSYDPGAVHSVPYTIFSTGIAYRADRVDPADVAKQGWESFWNTAYKGNVSVLDDYREGLAMAMQRRGLTDLNSKDDKIIAQAGADLKQLVDLVNVKVNIEGYKNIPEGSVTVAHSYSADMILAANGYLPDGTGPEVLGFWYPADNVGVVNNDCMCVMAKAEHPVLAHLYVNFMLDYDNAEKNFASIGYLPAVTKLDADYLVGKGYVPENLRNCVVTTEQVGKGLHFDELDLQTDQAWEAAWESFTAGG